MNRCIFSFLIVLLFACNGESQTKTKKIGGPCQGCEAIYEYGTKVLKPVDTLPEFNVLPYPIKINGTVYENDGKTPNLLFCPNLEEPSLRTIPVNKYFPS